MKMANIYTRLLLDKKDFDTNLKKAQGSVSSFATTTKGMFSGLAKAGGYVAAFVGISTSVHSAVTANMEFEKSLSSLRALTGVTAEELNYFRAEAIRMAMDSTQSATQMVEAYKLIGSQMPELLKNKTALTATAEAAVTLAEAAELDVPTAAKALTGSLNQMGQSSAHAAEYINILAAASQQGSADIPYLNKAVENAGGTASSVGIKFNELVAAIEAIAPRITDAASAGTNLRNIFLTLESSSDQKLRPSVVGLSRALDNLATKNMDATQLTKMFGKESVTAAIAILQERDAFEQLRTGITGTNTAYEQASINNDNLAGSVGKLQSAWEAFVNSMSASNGIIKATTDALTTMINAATRLMMSGDDRKKYDQDKKYSSQAKVVLENSNEWINGRVERGTDRNQAINDEIAAMGRMYPLALKYEDMLQEYEQKKAQYEKRFDAELGASINVMKKQLVVAERQKYIYDYVTEQLKAQKQEIIDKAKAEEEAARKAKIAVITTKPADNAPKGSTAYTDKLITEKRKELSVAVSDEDRIRINRELDELVSQKRKMEIEMSYPEGSAERLDNEISLKKKELSVAVSDQDRIRINRELDELVKKRRYMDLEVKYSKPVDDLKSVKEYANIRADLSEMTKLPEGWDKIGSVGSIGIKKQTKDINEYYNAVSGLSTALGNLGSTFDESTQSVFSYFSNVVSGAAQAAVAISALIPIKKAEANANMEAAATGVAASVAPIPFVGAVMAVGAVMSLIAAITAIPKFESGGIVGGSSFFGDKLLARVNSGEMILNQKQQKRLYDLTETNNGVSVSLGVSRIQGSDLYLALSNYMKKTGKKL